jgi:ABC-type bacteriocin/lantibiotic exporter with double-glycine peptidase domain
MKIFKKLLFFLSPQEKQKANLILILILIMALTDMIGVASIMPFMAVITNPGIIETNSALNKLFDLLNIFGVNTINEFIFVLGILVFVLLIFSLSLKAITSYFQYRFIMMRDYSIGKRLIETYLRQPYSWFLNKNSAELGKSILSEAALVAQQGIGPLMNLIAQGAVTFALIILLILVDLKLTLIVSLVIGGAFFLIAYFFTKFINRIGKERFITNQQRFKIVNEAFGAFKEAKLGGLEDFFIKKYSHNAFKNAKHQASMSILGELPRFFIEALAFGGMLLFVLYIISQNGIFVDAIPLISVYAFAGYRLIPSIQRVYNAINSLKFADTAITNLYLDLKNLKTSEINVDQKILQFNKSITLNNISYCYPNSSRFSVKDVKITIPVRKTIGIIGATGSGKTTIVDIILGLLDAQKGTLEIDNNIISKKNIKNFQRLIGYVPQNIFLTDDTIASNIAFGVDPNNIASQSIERSSKIANLHGFVINELPEQYKTVIGERGIRLSGGQRQRIGIARALYHDPKILILDEATSALDNNTEEVVMEAINKLSKNITIILIAHRLNTVKNCDIIFKFDKGQLVDQGSFNELFKNLK